MHCFAVGLSRSGKTTLCKALAKSFHSQKQHVFVYDPMQTEWDADFVTADFLKFVQACEMNRSAVCIVDECYRLSDKEDKKMLTNCLAYGRHYGHTFILIGQRFTAVPTTARNLCERLFVFKQAPRDADAIYDDFPHEDVKQLPYFQRGEFLDMTTFSCERRKIF